MYNQVVGRRKREREKEKAKKNFKKLNQIINLRKIKNYPRSDQPEVRNHHESRWGAIVALDQLHAACNELSNQPLGTNLQYYIFPVPLPTLFPP
jgi:hypothetical protein